MTILRIFICLLFIFTCQWMHASGLQFIENKGQFHENVHYEAALPGGKVFLENNTWTFSFVNDLRPHHNHSHGHNDKHGVFGHAYKMHFEGANPTTILRPQNPFSHHHNYFIGNDATKWASNVPAFNDIIYSNLYDFIDMKVYSTDNSMKYDFIVHPGGAVDDIVIAYEGVDELYLEDKNLIIKTSVNELKEFKPYAYQIIDGETVEVKCRFVLHGEKLYFVTPRGYNGDYDLTIDPELIFSTYTGSQADNWGFTATYDNEGNAYGGGIAFNIGYPTTTGPFDPSFNNNPNVTQTNTEGYGYDIAITKFSPDGTSLLYSTYLGGSGSEAPHSLVVNSQNQLIVMGSSSSPDYPTQNAFDATHNGGPSLNLYGLPTEPDHSNGTDIIVTIFTEDGNALAGSTFFGGSGNDGMNFTATAISQNLEFNYGDVARGEVIVDENDNIYVGSCTFSTDIVGTKGFQGSNNGALDGVIAKFNANASTLSWMTYIGGSSHDAVFSVKIAENGDVYTCGGTQGGNNFPANIAPIGLNQSYQGGSTDGYVLRVSNNGQNLLGGTYLGTNSYDQTYVLDIDGEGDIYTVGQTQGTYPVQGTVYSNANTKQFVHKLSPNLSTTDWSTTFGNGLSINISPTALLVDNCGNIYVSGWGGETNTTYNPQTGDVLGMPITFDAFQSDTDGSDLYFIIFSKDAQTLEYASYFGEVSGNFGNEHVDGGTSRFDKQGIVYHAVCASCQVTGGFGNSDNFPTTPGAWSNDNNSTNCNLALIKFDFQLVLEATANLEPAPEGCAPHTVNFFNLSTRWEDIYWDFGDGSPISTEENPVHVFEDVGMFEVMMIIVDSTTCNIADTAFLTVNVPAFTEVITAETDYELPEFCEPYEVEFFNQSVYDGLTEDYTFVWDFGNGVTSEEVSPTYEYPTFGSYSVSLTVTGAPPCFDTDTHYTTVVIEENPFVFADFESPDVGCIPFPITLEALDEAEQYLWDLGDGNTAEGATVEHTYTAEGTYTIQLITIDSTTCNISDTSTTEIQVYEGPVADFTFEQDLPYILVDIPFTNLSTPDMDYLWDFGDGTTSAEINPTHQYTQVGLIEICLTVTRPDGNCSDQICKEIEISDEFNITTPGAISPNGDGLNDQLFISGFGVERFRMEIFNRWGQKVFQATSFDDKWDGTYKGVPQELGVFLYYIEATVAGGKPYFRKGNITLIR